MMSLIWYMSGVNYFFRRIASLDEATRPAVIIVAGQVYPAAPHADLRLASFKSTLKTEIVDLGDQLHPRRKIELHNAGVKKCLQSSDGSIAIFGSQFHGIATAAITRLYKDGTSNGFLLEPQNQSPWFIDAAYTGQGKQFVAVRTTVDLGVVVEWISFR
jgi:hypothetical protein